MNGYMIPANAKRGNLIFNFFRPVDLIIMLVGFFISVFSLIFADTDNLVIVVIACLPLLIAVFLVIPVPNHHNILVSIGSIYSYYHNPRVYRWKGWCIYEQDKS